MKPAAKSGPVEPVRPGEIAIELPAEFDAGVYFIGTIHTPWKTRAECPKNPRESKGAICTIDVDERYRAGLAGLEAFTHVVVLYFMDRSQRDLIVQVPRHLGLPRGTFALRSPARPNPIAVSVAKLIAINGNRLTVAGLDCLDGTPLLDLKPYLPTVDATDWETAGTQKKKSARSSEN
jgi:tRNA-Thr(GGU) m(6)t(6)A37 methyltransferase TsaA